MCTFILLNLIFRRSAYSKRAEATKRMQASSQISRAVRVLEVGAVRLVEDEMFTSMRKMVMRRAMRPGTRSAGIKKEIQLITTSRTVGR